MHEGLALSHLSEANAFIQIDFREKWPWMSPFPGGAFWGGALRGVRRGLGPTRVHGGLQAEDQLSGLHVEEADLPAGEGGDHVGGLAAHQVHGGGHAERWTGTRSYTSVPPISQGTSSR